MFKALYSLIVLLFIITLYTSRDNINMSTNSLYVPLNQDVYSLAHKAYATYKTINPTTSSTMMIVDFSLPSDKYRLYLVDMESGKVLFSGLVAHGSNSGNRYASHFSNEDGSHKSSIGLYRTLNIYYGKHGSSLRVEGLDTGYNNNAFSRDIVIHSADYVSDSIALQNNQIGHSWGCFAVDHKYRDYIINKLHNSLIFAYYPDQDWIKNSKYLK